MILVTNVKSVKAYDENINFKNITMEDGLPQVSVETMLQDSMGYIWLGTNDGLSKYDGYTFKTYRYDLDNENSLIDNYIITLEEDQNKNIWVGTIGGISKIAPDRSNIVNYDSDSDSGNLSHNSIGDILVTKDNKILVGTVDGLNIYNKEKDKFERILKGRLSGEDIYSLDEDYGGNIWIGTNNGVNKYDLEKDEITHYPILNNNNEMLDQFVYKVYCDNDNVWVGTMKSGIIRINIKTGQSKSFIHEENNSKSLPSQYVRDFLRDSNGNLWVATTEGIAKYDEKNETFKSYKNKMYDSQSLVDDNVFCFMQDRTNLLWIGTFGGVSMFDPSARIEHYKNDPFDSNTISDNMIGGIFEDKDGYVWVGSLSKGLNIIDRKKDKIFKLDAYSNNRIFDITGVGDKIFVGTYNGLSVINKEDKTIKNYSKEDGLVSEQIKALYLDNNRYLWIGTNDGVNILDINTDTIIDISPILKENGVDDLYIYDIYKDSRGNYWIGSFVYGGLNKIDVKDKKIKIYKHKEHNATSITNNSVRSITEDDNGYIWVGTSVGLNKLNVETDEFTNYTTRDGLPNNTIYGVLFDDEGNPWMSTNMGISKYNILTDSFINFNITDGLQSNEFNGNAYFKSMSGELIFGGVNGLNIFKPETIEKEFYNEKVIFDEINVNGVKVDNLTKQKLKNTENNITIKLFLPDYNNMKNIKFYYTLEGAWYSKWTLMDSNSISFSKLSPGKYKFKVRARFNNGEFSDENSVEFTIKPPFFVSNIAIITYMIIIFIFVYYNKYRIRLLDKLVDKRTEELQAEMEKNTELFNKVIELEKGKNKYFVNLSHELRTPLNVIYSIEQLITELNKTEHGIEKDRLNHYMNVTRKNVKRLLKLINDIIDTAKIEHGSYKLNIEEADIVYLVEEAALTLKDYSESKGVELIIDPEIEEKIIQCDKSQIERCIVNLVGNAIKFTDIGGNITVNIIDLDDRVKIEVIDNGIGISPEFHKIIFDRFNQVVDNESEVKGGSGLGLTITKNIINIHHGHIYVESELNEGSKFTIILPVHYTKN